MKRQSLLVIVLVINAGFARGQETPTAPEPAFGVTLPYTEVLTPPAPINAVRMPLMFSSENRRENSVNLGLAFDAGYDDNLYLTPNQHIEDATYTMSPRLSWAHSEGRFIWDFGYASAFRINQSQGERNEMAHAFHASADYRLSPHVALRLRDDFSKTNSVFSGMMPTNGMPSPGPVEQSNISVIAPLADSIANSGGVDITYQFSPHSVTGVSGTYAFTNYSPMPGTGGLGYIDSNSWIAQAYYAHRFSDRHWIGLTYNQQRFLFRHVSRTDVNRVLAIYALPIGPAATVSVWAGPEFSSTDVNAGAVEVMPVRSTSRVTPAAGLALEFQGNRTRFRVGYRQQVSDGGGLAAAVTLRSAEMEAAWRMTSRWTASTSFGFGNSDPLDRMLPAETIRSWSAQTNFDYRLTEHLGIGFHYGRDQQSYPDMIPSYAANRNRAWISLVYGLSRPLGR